MVYAACTFAQWHHVIVKAEYAHTEYTMPAQKADQIQSPSTEQEVSKLLPATKTIIYDSFLWITLYGVIALSMGRRDTSTDLQGHSKMSAD